MRQPTASSRASLVLTLAMLLSLAAATGCGRATYPADRVTESLVALCRDEHRLDVTARLIGKTLWVYLPLEQGLLDEMMRFSEAASEAIEHVVLNVHRVTMSTDAPIDFYVVVVADTGQIGAELTLIGYTQDVRRARLLDISREEYQQRLIREIKLNPKALGDREGDYVQIADIYLPKFLAEQTCRRIQWAFQSDPGLSSRFAFRSAEWRLEGLAFRFLVTAEAQAPDVSWRTVLATSAEVITEVFRGYRYTHFETITIEDLVTGHIARLSSPDQLDLLHRGKLTVDQLLLPLPLPQ